MHCPAPFCPARDTILTCIVLTVRVEPSTTDLRMAGCAQRVAESRQRPRKTGAPSLSNHAPQLLIGSRATPQHSACLQPPAPPSSAAACTAPALRHVRVLGGLALAEHVHVVVGHALLLHRQWGSPCNGTSTDHPLHVAFVAASMLYCVCRTSRPCQDLSAQRSLPVALLVMRRRQPSLAVPHSPARSAPSLSR